jgi:hypothetical protein
MQASSWACWHNRSVGDTKTAEPESLLVASRPAHPRDHWLELIGAGAAGGFTGAVGADAYKSVKAACQAAVKKFREQPDPDEEAGWVPGSMATYEHFIYGSIREALDAVACDLTEAGYLVPDPPTISAGCDEGECPGCGLHWLLVAYGSVEKAFADDGRDDIDLACAAYGATYDGGGMYVGNGLDNRRANLAYVAESDSRPAAPLNPRPLDLFGKTAVTVNTVTHNSVTRQKKRKGKKKHR